MFDMRGACCAPLPRSGLGDGTKHRNRKSLARFKGSVVVGICRHREVFGHVETGYEDGSQVFSVPLVTGELNPGLVVTFSIFFELILQMRIFVVCWVPRRQCPTTMPRELN
jgi:hypothetical protein